MCGIHGILALDNGPAPDVGQLRTMAEITTHRGPDDTGTYHDQQIALGMCRLSIIDVGGGHQPLTNRDKSLWLVCNGEIYNFRELRKELIDKGHQFITGSDSEVIIHLYAEYGDEFIHYLNGMYGFALWDKNRQRLVLGRDRLGIKPFYYYQDGKQLIFASEAKAILAVSGVHLELSPVALQSYLSLGYVTAPNTLFQGLKKLPVASVMIVEQGRTRIQTYWQLPSAINTGMSGSDWVEATREKIHSSVKAQMVSDVPIGAFLSGGIDSSAVVAFMAKHSKQPVKTYAIGFEESKVGGFYNELQYARQVAELFATEHKEIIVKPDVAKLLPMLLWHLDEPMADAAFITTYLVAQFAREDVKVILSGVGGDELFGGYRRYLGEYYSQIYQKLPGWLRHSVLSKIAKHLPSDRHSKWLNLSRYARGFVLSAELPPAERYRSYVEVFGPALVSELLLDPPTETYQPLIEAFDNTTGTDPLNRLLYVDYHTQLPDDLLMLTDKMTMATSLECRVPLLDQELVELAAAMPWNIKIKGRELKHVLKRALTDVLPRNILYRPKRGFGAPMGAWLKRELAPLLQHVLSRQSIEQRGLFKWEVIQKTIGLHTANKEDYTDHLLALMNLELWARLYIDKQSPTDLGDELSEVIH